LRILKKKKKEEFEIIFDIERLALSKQNPDSLLLIRSVLKGKGGFGSSTEQQHGIPCPREGGTDPFHSLVVHKIVGYYENQTVHSQSNVLSRLLHNFKKNAIWRAFNRNKNLTLPPHYKNSFWMH
jgi:hypothetical protein